MSRISIIIPIYNQAKLLRRTLESLLAQSFRDFELILVNDGSTDDPQKVFQDFLSNNEVFFDNQFYNQSHGGAPRARNFGYSKSTAPYLFFCDADADLQPDALEILVRTLDTNPQVAYVYSSFYWGRKLFRLWPFDAERLRKMPYVHTMSLLRREAFPVSGWDESLVKLQDWDLWLTVLDQGGSGLWLDRPLFRIQPGGIISSWLPGFAYRLFPFLPSVKKYRKACEIVRTKHKLKK